MEAMKINTIICVHTIYMELDVWKGGALLIIALLP